MKLMTLVRAIVVGASLAVASASPFAAAQPPQVDGFVPVDQLPGQEELPAAPLVAAAYGVAWGAVLIYLFWIWKRLAAVEREMIDVAKRIEAAQRR